MSAGLCEWLRVSASIIAGPKVYSEWLRRQYASTSRGLGNTDCSAKGALIDRGTESVTPELAFKKACGGDQSTRNSHRPSGKKA